MKGLKKTLVRPIVTLLRLLAIVIARLIRTSCARIPVPAKAKAKSRMARRPRLHRTTPNPSCRNFQQHPRRR